MHLLLGEVLALLQCLIALAQLVRGGLLADRLLHQGVAQHIRARPRQGGLDRGIVGDALPLGLVGEQAEIDHPIEQDAVERLHRHLAELLGQAARHVLESGAVDRRVVDDRHHRVLAGARLRLLLLC